MTLTITGDTEADALLDENPFALLLGMLLDQQVTMESAFAGPLKVLQRTGSLDPKSLAGHDPEKLVEVFRETPAVHRYPGSMAERAQNLAQAIIDDWSNDTASIWTSGDPDGAEIRRRLLKLPGFGEQKAKIFLALLGKQRGVSAKGWREASAPYGEEGAYRSVADIVDADSLAHVRENKKAAKAAAKKK